MITSEVLNFNKFCRRLWPRSEKTLPLKKAKEAWQQTEKVAERDNNILFNKL